MPLVNSSVCLSVCLYNIRRYSDCESCTRLISTNPGSMEAGECGLTRGTCFDAYCLEVVAVAGLLWISWCVLDAAGFVRVIFVVFCFEPTRLAATMRPPCLVYPSASNEAVFAFKAKKPLHTGVRTVCHYLIRLSVYV